MIEYKFPSPPELVLAVIEGLRHLGGEGTNEQMREFVIEKFGLPSDAVAAKHSGNRTELEYKLAWARTFAKQKGLISPTGHMKWKLNSPA